MSMRTSVSSWWVAAGLCCLPTAAAAQEGKTFPECTHGPSERDVSAAKGAFEAGQVSFQEADYERAILYWEDAFRRDCTALALLLNLARAYELSEQKHNAVSALETYLDRRPNATDRDQITRRIEALRRQIEEERQAERESEPPPRPTAEPPAEDAGATTAHAPGTSAPPPATAPIWPLFVAGGGVATGIVGVVLWAVNQSTINECTKVEPGVYSCPNDAAADAARDAQAPRNVGIGLTIGGSALAIGGAVTYVILRDRAREGAMLTPSVGPGFAGLSYSGTF